MKKIIFIPLLLVFLLTTACSIDNKEKKESNSFENNITSDNTDKKNKEGDEVDIKENKDSNKEDKDDTEEENDKNVDLDVNNVEVKGGEYKELDKDNESKKSKEAEEVEEELELTEKEIIDKSEKFINDFLVEEGSIGSVDIIEKNDYLYKLGISGVMDDDLIYSHITDDGKIFFPQSMDIDMISSEKSEDDKIYSEDEIEIRARNFINEYLMDGGKAVIKNINKEYGLYKLSVDVGVEDLAESYITINGKLFFPQALIIEKIYEEDKNSTDTTKVNEVDKKNSRPQVKLFVMSHCPYGTQMEKAIIPVVKTLGDSIDFDIKFNTYAMHSKIELEEQMTQHCLMEDQEEKYLNYLECFLVDGDTDRCLAKTNINKTSLNNCLSRVEEKYNVISDFENDLNYQGGYPGFSIHEDDNYKYNAQGSPTLVINGQTIYSERNPDSLLAVICSAFITQPKACEASLSTESPAPGFGEKSSASSIEGSCN